MKNIQMWNDMLNEQIKPGMIVQHYKGGVYKVIAIGKDSEYLEKQVIYAPVDKPEEIWIRPLAMFNEVILEAYGVMITRFAIKEEVDHDD